VHIPNAFTPDANGHNEIFKPVIYGFEVSYYSLKIFNRWGILIFETNDPEAGWNGFYQDSIAEDGSYSWIMDIKNGADVEILRKFGKVILLR
jgi:gliding motility-associated-like protein